MPFVRYMCIAVCLTQAAAMAVEQPGLARSNSAAPAGFANARPEPVGNSTGHLTLHVAVGSECGSVGDSVTLTLDVGGLSDPINGVQALLEYDAGLLALESIVASDPWLEVAAIDDAGILSFAAVILGGSTLASETVVTLTFTRLADGTTNVIFRPDKPPFLSKLTIVDTGVAILPTTTNSGAIHTGLPDCTITTDAVVCPGSSGHIASVPDAGPGAIYAWTITGGTIDGGDGTHVITYSAAANNVVTLAVAVTGLNGCPAACQTDVTVTPTSLTVLLEVEALAAPVTRDVRCVVSDCSGSVDTRLEPVSFDASGMGVVVLTDVSLSAQWVSVSEGHTLSRLSPVLFDPCGAATVDLTGSRRLLAGDFHNGEIAQDGLVDIVDFAILAGKWNTLIDPNASFGADATGDGILDTADFSAILVNYFQLSENENGCIPPSPVSRHAGLRSAKPQPRQRIDADALPPGLRARADVNADGVVDAADLLEFATRSARPADPRR